MQASSWHINHSTSICSFKSGKCGKGKNFLKIEYLRMKRAFSMKYKLFFTVIEGLSLGKKNKNLSKNSGQKQTSIRIKSFHLAKYLYCFQNTFNIIL